MREINGSGSGLGELSSAREVKHTSAIPYYGAAAVWLLYALIFPMYRLLDYAGFFLAGFLALAALRFAFPGRTEFIEVPAETGDAGIDALLREGDEAVKELRALIGRMPQGEIKTSAGAVTDVVVKIFKDVRDDHGDYRQVRRFADFYLPAIIKLLRAYGRFSVSGGGGENVAGALKKIGGALDLTLASCEKFYDALFRDQALDIETDIVVLEQMLKKDGLADGGFDVQYNNNEGEIQHG
ncbi:MAG: 5-bromo-4-chloroindolyl phosphate hydrolysis family protein [Oscillospiraceae bacterium]|nr:5-bromo-4-chloroindolyl phosphate hydrolysis family protein [Oscillospiraceae bacterium]